MSPARILEIISPAGFERFFGELVDARRRRRRPTRDAWPSCAPRYELEMDPESIPGLLERFDLRIGEPLPR